LTAAKRTVLLIVLAGLHWHCHTTKDIADKGYCSSLKLEKGGCLAKCKTYTIEIHDRGSAEYTGKVNVLKIGRWYRMLTDQETTELWEFIKKNDIFIFNGFTGGGGEDSQMRLLVLTKNGEEKKISYGQMAPKVLMTLEAIIENIAETGEWMKL